MRIDVLTLFPGMIRGFLEESIIGRARAGGLLEVELHDIRDWTTDRHRTADDRPFGGGAGMVLKPEPLAAAIEAVRRPGSLVVHLTPDGQRLDHGEVIRLSREAHLILLSGHYEGIDQRIRDTLVDREISIGDYVLTNGTLPAAVVLDAVARQIPGVLGEARSLEGESFSDGLLGEPQYTRPATFRGLAVPEVLLSGNHAEIEAWRLRERRRKTAERRPDLGGETGKDSVT